MSYFYTLNNVQWPAHVFLDKWIFFGNHAFCVNIPVSDVRENNEHDLSIH